MDPLRKDESLSEIIPILSAHRQLVPLEDLLQVVALGRQLVRIKVQDDQGDLVGTFGVKGGMLLEATHGEATGKQAFLSLVRDTRGSGFVVTRRAKLPATLPPPIGTTTELLLEAAIEPEEPLAKGEVAAPRTSITHLAEIRAIGEPAGAKEPAARRRRVVAFTSPKGGVGKTTVSLNVALAFAQLGHRVVLVDADPLGGIRHALGDRQEEGPGLFDVLLGRELLHGCLSPTKVPNLSLLSAGRWRAEEDLGNLQALLNAQAWHQLFGILADQADLVIVDSPAGLYGIPTEVLAASTHLFAVVEAEPLALRSMPALLDVLAHLKRRGFSPVFAGVILNSVQFRDQVSLATVQKAWSVFETHLVLETTIPYDRVFLEANLKGVPVAFLDRAKRPPVAAVFEHLAHDIADRIGLEETVAAGEPLSLV